MENPEPLAGPHVEAANVTFYVSLAFWDGAGQVGCADDHGVACYNRGGVEADFSVDEIDLLIVIELQVDNTVFAEGRNGSACLRIQRNQAVTGSDVKDPF